MVVAVNFVQYICWEVFWVLRCQKKITYACLCCEGKAPSSLSNGDVQDSNPPNPSLSNYQKRKNLCHMHYLKHMHHKPGFDMVLNLRRTCVSLILLNTPVIRNLSFYLVTIYSYDGFFCFFTSVSSLRQTRHRMLRRWRSLTTYSSL